MQAVSFAALNIIASFLFDSSPFGLINRRNPLFKLMGFLSLLIYLAFAAILISHWRICVKCPRPSPAKSANKS